MEGTATNDKQVPYGMAVRYSLPNVEDDADAVSDPTCNQKIETLWRQ